MTLDEIRELIQLVSETGVAELEVQRGDNRVRIRRAVPMEVHEITVPDQRVAVQTAAPAKAAALDKPQPEAPPEKELVTVKSPIVGTFYESASPGAAPFVRVGENVQPGKVLCIIESMKLMNEIEAEIAGTIVSKLVPNGQPVEYGEALFEIRPL
ncbi:MAG TPA: acetyl-CoA carboxylase biotin carboxyl carrier protein [Bryobacteraceae bacterium]|nr:acetyl-CoA carboxylase biotin carboxyl carrier protein [Bryobacteraceae bacterium]